MDTKFKFLVTGSSGLVGKGIKSALENAGNGCNEEWIFISSKDADLRDWEQTYEIFKKHSPTHVINLAARVGGLFKNMNSQLEMFTENMAINENVLKACDKIGVQKCISCLSTCIFPDKVEYPIDETMVHLGPPHDSNYGYSYAKRNVDIMNRCYNERKRGLFTSVVPCNIFGPHDNYHLEDAHVLPAVIHKMYLAKKNSTDLTVLGSGNPLRQFIYSVDIGRMILNIARTYTSPEPIILAAPESSEISIKDVAYQIARSMKFDGKIKFDTNYADGQYKKTASIKKFCSLYPDFRFTSFEQAIDESVKWFLENYDSCRK